MVFVAVDAVVIAVAVSADCPTDCGMVSMTGRGCIRDVGGGVVGGEIFCESLGNQRAARRESDIQLCMFSWYFGDYDSPLCSCMWCSVFRIRVRTSVSNSQVEQVEQAHCRNCRCQVNVQIFTRR